MHEFGVAQGVLDTVRQRAGGRVVSRVRVRAGVRHGLDPASMAQALLVVAEGTEVAGAELDLVPVPVRLTCRRCAWSGETFDPLAFGPLALDLHAGCPGCGGQAVDLAGGDELVLESVTYAAPAEPPDPPRAAPVGG